MKLNKSAVVKRVLPVFAGGLLGFAYYYFIGCATGSCPITSNPYMTIAYGALMGGLFAFPASGSQKKTGQDERLNG